jgi:uncharacterized C2H2 Zn-finger protein
VSQGPTLIRQVVSLLDKVKGVEGKKVLLQLLSSLGERTEGRLEIARMDGFRKMLRLLVEGDDGLTRQVLRTLRHFLQTQTTDKKPPTTPSANGSGSDPSPPTSPTTTTSSISLPSTGNTSPTTGTASTGITSMTMGDDVPMVEIGPPIDHALEEVLGGASTAALAAAMAAQAQQNSGTTNGPASVGAQRRSIGSFAKQKVTGVVYELSKLALTEFHRVFPQGTAGNPAKRGVDVAGHHRPGSGSWDPSFNMATGQSNGPRHRRSGSSPFLPSFPPRQADINNVIALLILRATKQSSEQQVAADDRADDKFAAAVAAAALSGGPTAAAAATVAGLGLASGKLVGGTSTDGVTKSEDLLRELMRVQGALRALTDTLRQAALTVQLDLIDTIGKLLFNNPRNQREFASIDGYSFILTLLDEVTDYASSKDSQTFLASCFHIMLSIVLDGQPSKLVGNVDALRWLVHMVSHSEQTAVQLQALQCLQDLISINPLNAAYIKHVGGVDLLLIMLESIGRQTDGAVSFSGPVSGGRHCIVCRRAAAAADASSPTSTSSSSSSTSSSSTGLHKRGSRSNRETTSDDHDEEKKRDRETKHVDPSSPGSTTDQHGHSHHTSNGTSHQYHERMKNPMDLRALLVRIDELLKYMSAVLSRHDHAIASEYVRIILSTHLPIGGAFQQPHPVFTSLLLRSLIQMVCHFSFFGVEIADASVTSFVRLLHVFAKQMHAFLAAAVIAAAAASSHPSPAPSPLSSPTFAALHAVPSSGQLSSSSAADSSLPSTPKRGNHSNTNNNALPHGINNFDLKEITKEEGERIAALMQHATAAELGVSVSAKPRSRASSSDVGTLGNGHTTAARLRDTSSPFGTGTTTAAATAAITGAMGHGPSARTARAQMAAAASSSLNTRLTARWIWEHVSLVLELIGCSILLQPSSTQRRLAQMDRAHGFEAMYTLLHPRAHAPEEVTDLAMYLVRRFVSVREHNRVKKLNSLWTLASGTGGPAQIAAAQVATPAAAAAMVGAAVVVATTATNDKERQQADMKQREELAAVAAAAAAVAAKKEAARADRKADDSKKDTPSSSTTDKKTTPSTSVTATPEKDTSNPAKDASSKDSKDAPSTSKEKDSVVVGVGKDGGKSDKETKDTSGVKMSVAASSTGSSGGSGAPSTPSSTSSSLSVGTATPPMTPALPPSTPTASAAAALAASAIAATSGSSGSSASSSTSTPSSSNNASGSSSSSAAAAAAAEAAAVADALDEAESFCHWFVVLLEDSSVSDSVRLKILKATIILLRSPLPPLAGPHFSIKTGFREAGGVDALLAIIKTDAEHNHEADDDKSDSDGESDTDSVSGGNNDRGNNHSYSGAGRSYGYGGASRSERSRNGSYGGSRNGSRSESRTGTRRPQHRVSPDVCAAAFLALAEALRGCETNKAYIGETVGFCELSELLKRSSLTLGLHVFDVMFDLATTAGPSVARLHATGGMLASAREAPPPVLPSPLTDMRFKQVFGTMDNCLAAQRIIERLNRPSPLFVAPLPVSSEILQSLDPPSPEPPSSTIGGVGVGIGSSSSTPVNDTARPLISTRRSRSESSLTLLVEEHEHPLHTMAGAHSPMGRFPRSGSGSSDPGSNQPMSISSHGSPAAGNVNNFFAVRGPARSLDSIATNDSNSEHPPLSRPESFDSDSASSSHSAIIAGSHSPVHINVQSGGVVVSTSSSSNNLGNNGRRPSLGTSSTVFLTSTKFRSAEAAMMIVLLLPHAAPRVQQEVIKRLALLLEANPANKRALCQMNVLSTLLRLCPRFHEDVQTYYLQLVATLGLYDISAREVRLLFDLAALDPDDLRSISSNHPHNLGSGGMPPPHHYGHHTNTQHRYGSPQGPRDHAIRRGRELQMQMLYVIGRVTERMAPPAYFNFDGVVSSLMLAPQTRFPSARYGYSVCFWLMVNTFFGHESSLLTWVDHTGAVCFELLFQLIPGTDVHSRALCVRTKEGTFICSSYSFTESGQWHHITMTHNRAQLCLMVDGKLLHKFVNVFYPAASVSKSTPITGHVGAPPADSVRTTSFCGAIDTLHFMEGLLEEKQVATIFNEGTLFTGDPKNIGIGLKRFLVVQPGEYTAEPGGTLPSLTTTSTSSTAASLAAASPPDSPTLGSRGVVDLSLMAPLYLGDGSRSGGSGLGGTRSPQRSRSPIRKPPSVTMSSVREVAASPVRSPAAASSSSSTSSTNVTMTTATTNSTPSTLPSTTLSGKDEKKTGKDSDGKRDGKDSMKDGKMTGDKDANSSTKKETKTESKQKDDASPLHLPVSPVDKLPSAVSAAESSALANIWSLPKVRAPVDVHVTRTIKDEIRSVAGSLHLCLPFMTMGTAQQVAGLRILGGLLERCRPNMTEFLKSNGFELLGHVLAVSEGVDISRETCEVLLDITSGSIGTPASARTFMYPAGLLLVLDLVRLPRCDVVIRRQVLDSISQIVTSTSIPANLQSWRDGPAITGLIDLSRFVPDTTHAQMALTAPTCVLPPSLSYMLESILLVCRYEELELLLQCLAADAEERGVVYERAGLCRTLTGVMATKPVLVGHLAKAGGFELLFLLLRSPAASVRADCLRMLGFLFDVNPKNALAFTKQNYYDVLHSLLARHAPAHAVLSVLIELALGHIKCAEPPDGKNKTTTTTSSSSSSSTTSVVVATVISPPAPVTPASATSSSTTSHPTPPTPTEDTGTDGKKEASTVGGGTTEIKEEKKTESKVMRDEPKKDEKKAGSNEEKLNLAQPYVVRVLLQLLADCPAEDASLHLECLAQLDVVFDRADNMDKVLDLDWLLWARSYLQSLYGRISAPTASSSSSSSSMITTTSHITAMQRVLAKFHAILAKTVLRDLMRPYKQSKIGRAREMVEAPEFQVTVIEAVLDYFDEKPTLDKIMAQHMLRNMMALFDEVESLSLPPRVCVRAINTINVLASSNDGDVRTKMQDLGLLMLRDNLVLHCIRDDMPLEQRLETFRTFSFEMVSGHPKFRDSHGLLYMLKLFLECRDVRMQMVIADILRAQLGTHEENRRALTKIVQDVAILRHMFHVAAEDLKGNAAAAACFPMFNDEETDTKVSTPSRGSAPSGGLAGALPPGHTLSSMMIVDAGPRDDSVEEFVAWYFSDALTVRRVAIQGRLEKAFAPIEAAHRKTVASVLSKKLKRLRGRQDKLVKAQQATTKGITEVMERIQTRILPKCMKDYGTRMTRHNEQRLARQKLGDDSWNKIAPALRYVLPNNNNTATATTAVTVSVTTPSSTTSSTSSGALVPSPSPASTTSKEVKEEKTVAPLPVTPAAAAGASKENKDVSKGSGEKKDSKKEESKQTIDASLEEKKTSKTLIDVSTPIKTDQLLLTEAPLSPSLTVNTGSPRTTTHSTRRSKQPRHGGKRRNGASTRTGTTRTTSDPNAAGPSQSTTDTTDVTNVSSSSLVSASLGEPVALNRISSSHSADDSDDAVPSSTRSGGRRHPFRPALGASSEESTSGTGVTIENDNDSLSPSSTNEDLHSHTTTVNGSSSGTQAGEGSLNLTTLKIRTTSEDDLGDHHSVIVIPPLELPPRATTVATTTSAHVDATMTSSSSIASPKLATSVSASSLTISASSSASPSPSSSNHTRTSSHSSNPSSSLPIPAASSSSANPHHHHHHNKANKNHSLAELRCPHCQQMFKTQWDCICHIRLDHDHNAAVTNPPLPTVEPSSSSSSSVVATTSIAPSGNSMTTGGGTTATSSVISSSSSSSSNSSISNNSSSSSSSTVATAATSIMSARGAATGPSLSS